MFILKYYMISLFVYPHPIHMQAPEEQGLLFTLFTDITPKILDSA